MEVPVGTTELILILVFRILFLYFRSYTCITELILVLRNLYLRYRANSCVSDTEVPVGTTEHFTGTKVPVGTTEQIHYTEVPVGTTGLILILVFRILYLHYGTCTCLTNLILVLQSIILVLRILYRAYSGTKVPVGTTQIPYTEVPVGTIGLILILRIRKYS